MRRGINQKRDQEVRNKLAMTVKTLEVDFNPKMSQSGFIQVVTHLLLALFTFLVLSSIPAKYEFGCK